MGSFTISFLPPFSIVASSLTPLHSEMPKLYTILAFLSAVGLKKESPFQGLNFYKGLVHFGRTLFSMKHTESQNSLCLFKNGESVGGLTV